MKRIKRNILLIFVFLCLIGIKNVSALTSSMYTSSSYITTGQNVTATVTIKDFFSAKIHIECWGSTSNKSFDDISQSDGGNITRSFSLTCPATSIGQIAFSYSVEALDMAYNERNFSDKKIVVVQKPREKDSNNYLKSINVKDYKLTPEFNKETLEYSVNVPSTVDKVTLEAEKESNYASLSGIGEFEVNEGVNTFEINVTSETGNERVYKITVNVEDENPINISIDNNNYTIMKNAKTLQKPQTYEPTTVKIKDFDIPAFYSEISKQTLIGVKDSKGTTHFVIYDAEKSTYEQYNENKTPDQLLFIQKITDEKDGFTKKNVTINSSSYEALVSNIDENIILVKAMNIKTGDIHLYQYDKEEGTFIVYKDTIINTLEKEIEENKKMILYLEIALGIAGFLILLLLIFRPKRKEKKVKEKELEEVKIEKLEIDELKEEEKSEIEKKTPQKKNKRNKDKKKSQKQNGDTSEEKKEEVKVEQISPTKKQSKRTKEEALKQVSDAASIIEEYEKTIQLSKKELAKKKKEMEEKEAQVEATMYDIFEEDKKKRKR